MVSIPDRRPIQIRYAADACTSVNILNKTLNSNDLSNVARGVVKTSLIASLSRVCYFRSVSMKRIISILPLLLLVACDPGLTLPEEAKPGIAGTILFQGPWPPADSLHDLRIIASPIYPIDTTKTNLMFLVLQGVIQVYPALGESGLPYNVNTIEYEFPLPRGEYKYIAVFQQYATSLVAWRPVGVYTGGRAGFDPVAININSSEMIRGISINVDFRNLPPLPFE